MRKALFFLPALLFCCSYVQAQDKVTLSQNGLETTMSNGIISLIVGTNGRINTLTVGNSENLIGSTGIYFDSTRKGVGNKPLSPSKVEVIKHTDDYAEVLYTNTSYHPQYKQGIILRRGVSGIYTHILSYGDSQSADIQVQEMRICTRLNENFLNGYVDDRMQGRLPSSAEIARCEADASRKIQDATWYLDDGKSYEGDVHLTASIAGASRTPSIKVAVNGTDKATWQFPTNDAGIYIWRQANRSGKFIKR